MPRTPHRVPDLHYQPGIAAPPGSTVSSMTTESIQKTVVSALRSPLSRSRSPFSQLTTDAFRPGSAGRHP
jgi:hypothetical protein